MCIRHTVGSVRTSTLIELTRPVRCLLAVVALVTVLAACTVPLQQGVTTAPETGRSSPDGEPSDSGTQADDAPAKRAVIPRFENRIAETLLHNARAALDAQVAGLTTRERLHTAEVALLYETHGAGLRRSVNFELLSPETLAEVQAFLVEVRHWQERARHADAFDALLAHQRTAEALRHLLLPAASWDGFSKRAAAATRLLEIPGSVLPAGWRPAELNRDISARFAAQRHALGVDADAPPGADVIRLPHPAERVPTLGVEAFDVLLGEAGHALDTRALHDLARQEVERLGTLAGVTANRTQTPLTGRQERLSALAGRIGELMPRISRIVPVSRLPDLVLWRVERGREEAAPQLEYMPSGGPGLPAVLYVNLADASAPLDDALTAAAAEAVLGHHLAASRGNSNRAGWSAFVTDLVGGQTADPMPYQQHQLRRWVWVAIDTGLHLDWSRSDAVAYARRHTGLSAAVVSREIAWIALNPGRRAGFLPGKRALDRAWQRLSTASDTDTETLRRLLDASAVPLALLEGALQRTRVD